MQRRFSDILQVDVKSRLQVEAINGLDIVRIKDGLPYPPGDFLVVRVTILTTELFIKTVLESGSPLVFINEADGSAGEICERHVTHVDLLEDGAPPQPAFPENRPLHHHLLLLVVNLPAIDHNVLLAGFTSVNQQTLILILRTVF